MTADYLLGLSETKNHSNADFTDLRLSDDMQAPVVKAPLNLLQQLNVNVLMTHNNHISPVIQISSHIPYVFFFVHGRYRKEY